MEQSWSIQLLEQPEGVRNMSRYIHRLLIGDFFVIKMLKCIHINQKVSKFG